MPPFRGKTPWKATFANQIIVEGQDDQMAFDVVAGKLRKAKESIADFDVQSADGKDKITAHLKDFTLQPEFLSVVTSIVIVGDADQDRQAAFSALQKALTDAGLPAGAQESVWAAGTFEGRTIRTRIETLPPTGTGTLEDLVLAGIPPATIQCVDNFLACAASFGVPKPIQLSKAKIQALAATHIHDGYMHLGAALRDGKLPLDHPAMEPLREILRCL